MIILDEHVPPSQRHLLRSWHIAVRQIGYDIGRKGMQDDEIIPFLRSLRRPTFFSLDFDFYKRDLCHPRYCLVYLSAKQYEAATFVRRLLHHPQFDTQLSRMGMVVRLSHADISIWRLQAQEPVTLKWPK